MMDTNFIVLSVTQFFCFVLFKKSSVKTINSSCVFLVKFHGIFQNDFDLYLETTGPNGKKSLGELHRRTEHYCLQIKKEKKTCGPSSSHENSPSVSVRPSAIQFAKGLFSNPPELICKLPRRIFVFVSMSSIRPLIN